MATFAEGMISTTTSIIDSFGSDCTLSYVGDGGNYNPITETYDAGSSIEVVTKCAFTSIKNGDDTINEFPTVTKVGWLYYNDDVKDLSNQWKCNNNKIYKIVALEAQNKTIAYKIYIG